MSATNTHTSHDSHGQPNNSPQTAVNLSAPPPGSDQVIDRFMNHGPDQGDPVAVEQLIAHVLRRAHQAAERFNGPDEARAIFHVAVSFAEELSTTSPEFDRSRFIKAATGLP